MPPIATTKYQEPSWHRNLRRDRSRIRRRLRRPELLSCAQLDSDIGALRIHHGSQPPRIAHEYAVMYKTGRGGYSRGGQRGYYTSSDADHTPTWLGNNRATVPPWNQHLDPRGRGSQQQAARQSQGHTLHQRGRGRHPWNRQQQQWSSMALLIKNNKVSSVF